MLRGFWWDGFVYTIFWRGVWLGLIYGPKISEILDQTSLGVLVSGGRLTISLAGFVAGNYSWLVMWLIAYLVGRAAGWLCGWLAWYVVANMAVGYKGGGCGWLAMWAFIRLSGLSATWLGMWLADD